MGKITRKIRDPNRLEKVQDKLSGATELRKKKAKAFTELTKKKAKKFSKKNK